MDKPAVPMGGHGFGRTLSDFIVNFSASQGNPLGVQVLQQRQQAQQQRAQQEFAAQQAQVQQDAEQQRQMALVDYRAAHPEPTEFQRTYEYLQRTNPQAAAQYLSSRTDPLVPVQGVDANGNQTVTMMSRSTAAGGAPAAAPPAVDPATGLPAGYSVRSGGSGPQGRGTFPVNRLVNNGREVIQSLFPQARVTDWLRDPNSALGRANPGSYHNRTRAAVDVAPIPGMTFEQYTARLRAAGYPLVEALDEQRHPLHHTTGPNWHVVLGQRS